MNRVVSFLNESNRIEGIERIDYSDSAYQTIDRGHFGAFLLSQQAAASGEPLSIKKIKEWQRLITTEQRPYVPIDDEEVGHLRSPALPKNVRIGSHIPPGYNDVPTLLDALIERTNEVLKNYKHMDDVSFSIFLGSTFLEFEKIHPFADGNGRVGRLIANYIATYYGRPIIVFNSEMIERNAYLRSHDSKEAMIIFMAQKIQEAVFGIDGKVLIRTKVLPGSSGEYVSEAGGQKTVVHWHHLANAVNTWKQRLIK